MSDASKGSTGRDGGNAQAPAGVDPRDLQVMVTLTPSDFTAFRRHVVMAEAVGIDGIGLADSPSLYQDPYVAAALAAGLTSRVAIGPMVTNFVTRDPVVTARALASLEAIVGPGRVLAGVGAGYSALNAAKAKPLPVEAFRTAIHQLRATTSQMGAAPRVMVAAAGSKTMSMGGVEGDAVLAGAGINDACVNDLLHSASRAEAWVVARTSIGADRDRCLDELLPVLASGAVQVFNLPPNRAALAPDDLTRIEELRARYDFNYHVTGEGNPNAALIKELGLEGLLADRFAVVGSAQEVADRFGQLAASGVRGVFVPAVGLDIERLLAGIGEVISILRGPRTERNG